MMVNDVPGLCGAVAAEWRAVSDSTERRPDSKSDALSSRRLHAASLQTQFWSMPETYLGSVTLSNI
jgi:hypothetical protein